MKDLIDILNELAKALFTGKLTINFYKDSVGKIQLTRTIKNSDDTNTLSCLISLVAIEIM